MALLSDGMARKSKLSRLLGDREPGLAHAALGGPPLALQQFQFGHAQQVARIVDIFGGALPGHPVVLTQEGGHPTFIPLDTFSEVQAVLTGHNRPKYSKREIAFRGLMNCAYDDCMVTGEIQKQKYVYYRCTGHRGKCDLPRFTEEDIALKLGEPLKSLQVPSHVVTQIVETLREDANGAAARISVARSRLEARLTTVRNRIDNAYTDKVDGAIDEEMWRRKSSDWRMEEQQIKMAMDGLKHAETGDKALDAQRILELANSAYSLYVSQNPVEKAKLLRMVFSNCSVDAVSVTPTYRKPFDMIFKRAQLEEWSGRRDSNPHPLVPRDSSSC
jgi:site-specific DNA recombinase